MEPHARSALSLFPSQGHGNKSCPQKSLEHPHSLHVIPTFTSGGSSRGSAKPTGSSEGPRRHLQLLSAPGPAAAGQNFIRASGRQLPLGLQPLCSGAVGIHGKSQTVGGIPARSPHPHLSRHPTTADGDTQTLLRFRSRFLLR